MSSVDLFIKLIGSNDPKLEKILQSKKNRLNRVLKLYNRRKAISDHTIYKLNISLESIINGSVVRVIERDTEILKIALENTYLHVLILYSKDEVLISMIENNMPLSKEEQDYLINKFPQLTSIWKK